MLGKRRTLLSNLETGFLTYTADGRMMGINTDQVRYIVNFRSNRMTLRTPPILKGGVKLANQELVWEG